MSALTTAEEISNLAFGFMGSKALFGALHVDVFGALDDGALTVEELANKTDIKAHRLTTMTTALVSLGLLEQRGDKVANSPAASDYLVPDAKAYFGDYLCYQIDQQMYPMLHELENVLKDDLDKVEFDSYETWMENDEEAELFSRSQHGGSLGPGAVLARRVDLSDAKSLLDVGGGTGAFSIMMCKRYPDLKASVMDFPNVVKVAERYIDEAGMSDRIDLIAGNGIEDAWLENQDAVLLSYICGGVPHDAVPTLIDNAFKALRPGGTVMVHDFMVNDQRSGPKLAALWAMQHMVYTPDGIVLTPGFIHGLLEDAGFTDIVEGDLIPGMTRVLWATKPK